MSMELVVKDFTLPEAVEFNFEELKEAVSKISAKYESHIYTPGQLTEAKKDLASLRKFSKMLNDERIRLEREYMQPFQEFKNKINELIGIINGPISSIDEQAKFFEEEAKTTKKKQIFVFFESCSPFEWLDFEQIFNPKWLNTTVKIPAIEKEIEEIIKTIKNDLETLANLPEFGFEATEVYKTTLDINKAISEGQRMAEVQKTKAEYPPLVKMAIPEETTTSIDTEVEKQTDEVLQKAWISFKALLSTEDALALKQFFDDRNIVFEKI